MNRKNLQSSEKVHEFSLIRPISFIIA